MDFPTNALWDPSVLLGEDFIKSEEENIKSDPPALDNNNDNTEVVVAESTPSTRKRRAEDADDDEVDHDRDVDVDPDGEYDGDVDYDGMELGEEARILTPTDEEPSNVSQDSLTTTSPIDEKDYSIFSEAKSEPDTSTTPLVVEPPSLSPMEEEGKLDDGFKVSEGIITFKVEDASTMKYGQTYYSDPVVIRNLLWKIMLAPKRYPYADYLGVFLECNLAEKDKRYKSWRCGAIAKIALLCQTGGEHIWRRLDYMYKSNENDRGFSDFLLVSALLDEKKGYLINKSFTVRMEIKVDPPHYAGWPSKRFTGFVGLNNQGATCYMNSLLQSLYFTNQLRQAVYKMPTAFSDSRKNVPLALQRVFYKLQTSDKSVSTQKLTKAFGFESMDSLTQQDVQEFFRILLDKLECNMKGTCVEGMVPKLFEGKMISYIKCKHVEYESSRPETFYDIQLNIQNKKDIYESFADYVATEDLDGDNKYDAGSHGLQEAEKGVIFESFPPVLHLHLLRFQYNPLVGYSTKCNDRFEFYDHINLDKYLKNPPSSTTESASYTLHAVLVHMGDENNGHYVAFINPRGDGNWCKFDDDVVFPSNPTEALQYNFGGLENREVFHPGVYESTNAYMLVYIRDSDLATVLQEVGEADLAPELLERWKEEDVITELKRKQGRTDHLYLKVEVLTEGAFMGHQGPYLYDYTKYNPAVRANSRRFDVLKAATPSDLLPLLAETYGVNEKRMRLWSFIWRQKDHSIRPLYMTMDQDEVKSLEESKLGQSFPFFLEMLPADDDSESLPPYDYKRDLLIFIKMYDPATSLLHYCGHWTVPFVVSCVTLAEECRRRVHWASDVPIELYEEIGYDPKRIWDLNKPLSRCFETNNDGNIVVFHKTFSSKKLTTLLDYYGTFVNNKKW